MIERREGGYFHLASSTEVRQLVTHAYEKGIGVRVRGSGHSAKGAIHNDGFDGEGTPSAGSRRGWHPLRSASTA